MARKIFDDLPCVGKILSETSTDGENSIDTPVSDMLKLEEISKNKDNMDFDYSRGLI